MIKFRLKPAIIGLCFTVALTASGPGLAEEMQAQVILDSDPIDIPLVIGDLSSAGGAERLWVSGDRTGDGRLAQMTARPVQAAELTEAGRSIVLWRGFRGGTVGRFEASELPIEAGPRYFCGPLPSGQAYGCFLDETGDGRFDRVAPAVPERGIKPYHLTIVGAARPLPTPLAYRILADAERPSIPIVLRNCDKDYDRPRFIALSDVDKNVPFRSSALEWHAKDSTLAQCQRGQVLDQWPGASAPAGGFLAQLGPAAFAIGSKKNPTVQLLGPVDPDGLYRLEGATLVSMGVGYTPNQAELVARKKYPQPFLMAEPGARVNNGVLKVGAVLATVPFRHAYRGRLTQDVTIRTLFGKRAVAAGTVVYGFPARSRVSVTQGGIPLGSTVDDSHFRKINLTITWCAPVQQPVDPTKKPDPIARNGWTAACLPESTLSTYTILTGLRPAFTVSSLQWALDTSSNDGAPPIARDDAADFGRPLRVDYVYAGRSGDMILFDENIYAGDELTSVRRESVFVGNSSAAATIAGAAIELRPTDGDGLSVRVSSQPSAGVLPLLDWDRRAFMIKQAEQLGLRLADEETAAEETAATPK